MFNIIEEKKENVSFKIKNADIIKSSDGGFELKIKFTPDKRNTFIIENKKKYKKNLTPRELQVLEKMYSGKTNKQIAEELIVTSNTIKAHVARILKKLEVENRQQAILLAEKEKIILN